MLHTNKTRVNTGEVNIRKEVTTEQKIINVPVEREEFVIERHAAKFQSTDTNNLNDIDDTDGPGPKVMGASSLIGNDVYNNLDEDLGDIKEIMIDMSTGKVAYAVLAHGGVMGLGEKLFAVPWEALKLDTLNERFMLNVEKTKLDVATGFDSDHWPDRADSAW